jgi:peptidoglycan/xylan/chitin deacetylase (PgdA/CDA1 family)
LGGRAPSFAYPYGEHDPRVRAAAQAAGFQRAYGLAQGAWGEPYALPRLDLYRVHNAAKTVKASLAV